MTSHKKQQGSPEERAEARRAAWRALAADPAQWPTLDDETFRRLVYSQCLEYGTTQDETMIAGLHRLYHYNIQRTPEEERFQMCLAVQQFVEMQQGAGVMAFMPFLHAEESRSISSTAALAFSVLCPLENGDPLFGPRFLIRTIFTIPERHDTEGDILAGILLLGDRRLLPLLEDAWERITDKARERLAQAESGFAYDATIEFFLRCLEKGCDEGVFGSVAAAIARVPLFSETSDIRDVERVFPAYANSAEPVRLIQTWSFQDYLAKIRSRLDRLAAVESEPKVIPQIIDFWSDPDRFKKELGYDN